MRKKILLIIILCFLSVSIFALNQFFIDSQSIATFKNLVVSELKIPLSVLNDYKSQEEELSQEASNAIKTTTLKNLGYEHWLDYLDYIELNVYQANVTEDAKEELIVAVNLSKDLAAMAVYSPINQEYVYKAAIKDLLPIKKLSFIKVPNEDFNFLVTEQLLDERFGAFFIDQFLEIYLFENDGFTSVFKKSKYLQEVYNLKWIDPSASNDQWVKIIENNAIDFEENKGLNIEVSISREKLTAQNQFMPKESEYKTVEKIATTEIYYWSPKFSHFIIFEGIDKKSTAAVAVIEDTASWKEHLLGLRSNNYRIKTVSGEIIFQGKDSIISRE